MKGATTSAPHQHQKKQSSFWSGALGALGRRKSAMHPRRTTNTSASVSDQRGFTIVEISIVLAVTGALFLAATILVAGQAGKTAFDQSIQDIQSVTEQRISEVGAGFYANTGNFKCDGSGGQLVFSSTTGGDKDQGANNGCIFLGKVLQFGIKGTDPQNYEVYTVAGLQKLANGALTQTLAQAKPVVIAPGNTGADKSIPNATVVETLHNGITAVSMKYVSSSGTTSNIGAVAFISSQGNFSGSDLVSGSQQVDMVPITGTAINVIPTAAVDAIDSHLMSSKVDDGGSVQICFASGSTNQSGLLTIGNSGNGLATTLTIKSGQTC